MTVWLTDCIFPISVITCIYVHYTPVWPMAPMTSLPIHNSPWQYYGQSNLLFLNNNIYNRVFSFTNYQQFSIRICDHISERVVLCTKVYPYYFSPDTLPLSIGTLPLSIGQLYLLWTFGILYVIATRLSQSIIDSTLVYKKTILLPESHFKPSWEPKRVLAAYPSLEVNTPQLYTSILCLYSFRSLFVLVFTSWSNKYMRTNTR